MSPLWFVLALLPVFGSGQRFSCKGRILGAYYADAKSGCKAFHVCVRVAGGGVRDFRFYCPPGTLFHQEAQTCTDWGDDDPLACPADIYDGQFDLYRIGSGYDTKKLSSTGNREEEIEFGLQRAETGDRRLAQNPSPAPSGPASDLRAAHSSDFFSGQRERGRDDAPPVLAQPAPARQSFRRPSHRVAPTLSTTLATEPPLPSFAPSNPPPQQEIPSKRKLIRKRPVYTPTSTFAPTTFTENYPRQRSSFSEQPKYFTRRPSDRTKQQPSSSPLPQYNEEYVEVSRVTPKANRHYSTTITPVSYTLPQQSTLQYTKKEGLTELYNFDRQPTSGFSGQNENRSFKTTLRNSFSVSPSSQVDREYENTPRKNIEIKSNGDQRVPGVPEFNNGPRNFVSTTQVYRNQNSVSYEPEKNNFIPFSGAKQNFAQSPTQPPTTTAYTTYRTNAPLNLNTVAYKTNIGFDARPNNFEDNSEDDGQYRPPSGEDDGQYRPELYEKELLSGAHSLNIAASGNRLPEDQKPRHKPQPKPVPAVPRPFSPQLPSSQTTRAQETTYATTTVRIQPVTSTQRVFDFYQPYTTTSRPNETPVPSNPNQFVPNNPVVNRPVTTTTRPSTPEPRPVTTRPSPSPTTAPNRPTHRPPAFSQPVNKKEDNSYDYAYYDSDSGFSEYDHIEEFGKTKTKV